VSERPARPSGLVAVVTWGSVAIAALAFVLLAWGWMRGGGAVVIPWSATWNLQLHFALDGLAALYGLLATGVGVAVLVYSARYIPLHLSHEHRHPREQMRFCALMLFFLAAMLGLVMARDLIVLVVFFDLTAVASYLLIGFDRHKEDARRAALMALLVTGGTSVLLLGAAVAMLSAYGTADLASITERARSGLLVDLTMGLALLAAMAKSAQVPLHFWLPRAMAAPTPVSAFLHSAAMVAAGVFLLQRLFPLLHLSTWLPDVVVTVGALSMVIGGIFALTRDGLKQILAYSTIAQFGYVMLMLGLGGHEGAAGASFYVLAHGLLKSALFLTAGAVTEATREDQLSRIHGMARRAPFLAIGSAVAAAGLAGLPLTLGFFKDEMLFRVAWEHGVAFAALSVVAAAITFAYMWRFWSGIFLGPAEPDAHRLSPLLVAPIVVLSALVIAGGVVVHPATQLASAAATASAGVLVETDLAYHFDLRPTNVLALVTYALAALLIFSRRAWRRIGDRLASMATWLGPERWYERAITAMDRGSIFLHRIEARDLRDRLIAIFIPAGALVALGLIARPTSGAFAFGWSRLTDLPLAFGLLLTAGAAIAAMLTTHYTVVILAVSGAGYGMAIVFAFGGASDVALVAVLINTVLTVLMIGVVVLFPRDALRRAAARMNTGPRRRRDMIAGLVAGVSVFIVTWGALSRPAAKGVAEELVRLAPKAHAKDAVTAILADFRGIDTMVESSVLIVALLGVLALLPASRR
jgi:multicomponent Na+:H+ antiporter subunit A